MSYDEDLANRVRELLAVEHGLTEQPMFGGISFLLDGNLTVAVSSRGGLLLRIGRDAVEPALARPHTEAAIMGAGREMKDWLRVSADGVRTQRQLASWLGKGVDFARGLPRKG